MEEDEKAFAGLRIHAYPSIKEKYLGHWRINIKPPVTHALILLLIYGYVHVNIAPFLENGDTVRTVSMTFTALILYLQILLIYEGPGYLPHDYPNHKSGTPDIAMYQSDVTRASKTGLKERTQYVSKARRFVIQYITWDNTSGTCIGKRNGKLYLWRSFTSIIYALYITSSATESITGIIYVYNIGLMLVMNIIVLIITSTVAVTLSINLMTVMNTILLNTKTDPGLFNTDFTDNRSITANLKEIMGKNVLTWLFPIPAFIGRSDDELYTIHGI